MSGCRRWKCSNGSCRARHGHLLMAYILGAYGWPVIAGPRDYPHVQGPNYQYATAQWGARFWR